MTKNSLIKQCKSRGFEVKTDKIEVDRVLLNDSVSVIFVNRGHFIVWNKTLIGLSQDIIQLLFDAKMSEKV